MAQNPDVLTEGWYQPPPGGLAILLGQPPLFERLEYESLRDESSWASSENILKEGALVYAYASPVHSDTGLLGDIGVTLYSGKQQRIRDYLRECLDVSLETAKRAEIGMPLRELYTFADRRIRSFGYRNQTPSSTDPSSMNIGHTVPWSYESGLAAPALSDPAELRGQIKRGRMFLNGGATQVILPDMAFTVEPRLIAEDLPLCGYHIIVVFDGGSRHVLTGFEEIFELFEMDYML
jgi:hypothetical protein